MTAEIELRPDLGNVDIRYAARCGAGYRNDDYAHGRLDLAAPAGEQTVTQNLEECVRSIASGALRPSVLVTHRVPFEFAPSAYALAEQPDAALGILIEYGGVTSGG